MDNIRQELYYKWQQYQYYVIIAIVSVVALFLFPMLGTEVGLAWVIPNTVAGWVVYITNKVVVAILNVLIFHCFNLQAKINIKDNTRYLAALEILRKTSQASRKLIPRSPAKYNREVYGKKGTTIAISSILGAVGLTQAILTFDWVSMLSYLFIILMGLIFGVLQMNNAEAYWTEEYYEYALLVQKKEAEKTNIQENNNDNN